MPASQAVVVNPMITDRFEIFHVNQTVEEDMPLHYHDYYEINCVLKGSGVFYLDGDEYETTPGTVILVNINDLHNIVRQSTDSYERAYAYVTDEYLKSHSTPATDLTACFSHYGKPVSRVIRVDPDMLAEHIAKLDEKPGRSYGDDIMYEQRFLELMIALNKAVLASTNDIMPESSMVPRMIGDVMSYIGDHLDEDLSLDALAARFYINKYYLSREFKKHMRVNLHEYTLTKRLLKSKELLRRTGNAKRVYHMCGFKSYTHFLRCFKREFGMTPKAFVTSNAEPDVIRFEHAM
ncbi:AraC family transcriptional regulator [Bifidobacterium vespertilionis]|uniref:AraC family transcriptional regulator n=1 Tax=Bifidobacterium vespertilionis TaxID=2562524 RepID=UPI001BDBD043|nr:AraC family transcriptional regulator [Bifidobacterium vespertilionis]MBT1178519.1 helix-turn-helix domain-containing protein [Bifidobacterium vespertilionis]